MKLSVIVPVYNMASDDKLSWCLNSLVNQTISDYEIIAVDDCSTDDSLSILRQFEQQYPNKFKVIASPVNKKQGGAKNLGLLQASGEWIGFIDSDDWITPDFYEKLLTRAEETGADMVGCDYHLTGEHSMEIGQVVHNNRFEQTGVLTEDKYRSLILDGGSLVVKIYKRHIIFDYPNRFPENIFYEDNAIGNFWMLRSKHFEYIQEPMYYYYQHDTSTVHTITKKRCEDRMAAARIMIDEAREFDFLDKYYPELESSFTTLFYVNTLFSYMAGVPKTKYSFVKALGKEMKETFPGFQQNKYYETRVHAEERKLIRMQMQSTLLFMVYYKLMWAYRNWRKACGVGVIVSKKNIKPKRNVKSRKRIYVCHTFYHVYIACLKELQLLGQLGEKNSSDVRDLSEVRDLSDICNEDKADLLLSSMSNDFGNLQERLEKSGLFREVKPFDEKEDTFFPELAKYRQDTGNLIKNMLQRIKFTRRFGKLLEPYIPVDLRAYEDIYVFCDSDPIGYYLATHHIYYHAVEDGLDCIKYYDTARYDNRGHFGLKAWMAARNLIFIQNGYSKYCLDMEVNNSSILDYPCAKYIEKPRTELLQNLTEQQKETLVAIFIENKAALEKALHEASNAGMPMILILTEPLCDLETRERIFRDIIALYSEVDGQPTRILLKPHPRDVLDYEKVFSDYIVLDKKFPMEILNFVKDLYFDKVISVLTVPHAIQFAGEKVFLGEDFLDHYEAPEIHRQNEQIY